MASCDGHGSHSPADSCDTESSPPHQIPLVKVPLGQIVALVGPASLPSASFHGRKAAVIRIVHRDSMPDLVMVALAQGAGVADYLAAFAQPPGRMVQAPGSKAWEPLAQALLLAALP